MMVRRGCRVGRLQGAEFGAGLLQHGCLYSVYVALAGTDHKASNPPGPSRLVAVKHKLRGSRGRGAQPSMGWGRRACGAQAYTVAMDSKRQRCGGGGPGVPGRLLWFRERGWQIPRGYSRVAG